MASPDGPGTVQERLQAAHRRVESLKQEIATLRAQKKDSSLTSFPSSPSSPPPICALRSRRLLRGHFGKVSAACWGSGEGLLSAGQDGRLLLWNGRTALKWRSLSLGSCWVMACAANRDLRNVASGGMDNVCTVFRVEQGNQAAQELLGHTGYLSSMQFVGDRNMLTSSGDSSCIYWDLEKGRATTHFKEHKADVMSVRASPVDLNIFASGSVDTTCKMWDIRSGEKSCMTFRGHSGDINSISFFPDGQAIGTGSDDTSCRVFDMRCAGEVGAFGNPQVLSGITSVSFSRSGRILFAGYEDFFMRAWDMTADPSKGCAMQLGGHENRVSSVDVNSEGDAVLTASWDTTLRVWA